jgi:hypothetical protein
MRKKIIYISIIVFLTFTLLTIAASTKVFLEDEAFTARSIQQNFEDLNSTIDRDVHPALFLNAIRIWGSWLGYEELNLRSFSIFFSLLTLLLTYKLASDLFDDRVAILALLLIALYPLLIMFGHNARYYSLSSALSLLIVLSTFRFQKIGNVSFLILYIISSIAFLNLIFSAVFVLIIVNLWWIIRWFKSETRSNKILFLWLFTQAIVLILYLPVLSRFYFAVQRFHEVIPITSWLIEFVKRSAYFGFVISVGETISPLNPISWVGILLLIIIIGSGLKRCYPNQNFWLPVGLVLTIAITNLMITMNAAVSQTWQNISYRSFYLYPFLAIWLSVGIINLPIKYSRLVLIGFLLVYSFSLFNYFSNREFLRPIFTMSWRNIFSSIKETSSPDTIVICGSGDTTCGYYLSIYGYEGGNYNYFSNLSLSDYPSEVWWFKINRTQSNQKNTESEYFENLFQVYQYNDVTGYAPYDKNIRYLKSIFFNKEIDLFWVEAYHFYKLR